MGIWTNFQWKKQNIFIYLVKLLVIRELASECNIEWKERWPFTSEFINLKSSEGLNKLESFLSSKTSEHNGFMTNVNNKINKKLDLVCEKLEKLIINGFKIDSDGKEVEEDEGLFLVYYMLWALIHIYSIADNIDFVTTPSSPGGDDFYDAMEEFEDDNINFNIFIEG